MENLKKQNILMFEKTMNLGGSSKVVLQLCETLKPHVNNIVVCSSGGINVKGLDKMEIRHYKIGDISNINPINIIRIMIELIKIMVKEKITIVHTHHRIATIYIKVINIFNNVRIVSTLHGLFQDNLIITKWAYTGVDIIACGNEVKKQFVKFYGIDSKKITVIHNTIQKEMQEEKDIRELSKYKEKYTLLAYIGRISPEKGLEVLIKAMAEIKKSQKNILCVIVGDGDKKYKSKLKNIIENLQTQDNILFLGYRDDIQNVIRQVDCVVLPSYTEGLPLTPIESFSQGKPVIATKAGGTPEIISHGYNGLLCDIGDYHKLASNILEVCENQILRNILAINAIKTYKKKFSFDKFQKDVIEFYSRL